MENIKARVSCEMTSVPTLRIIGIGYSRAENSLHEFLSRVILRK